LPSGGAIRLPGCAPCSTAFGVVYFACPTANRSSLFNLPYQAGIKLLPRVWQQASSLCFNFRGARDQLDSPLPHRLGRCSKDIPHHHLVTRIYRSAGEIARATLSRDSQRFFEKEKTTP